MTRVPAADPTTPAATAGYRIPRLFRWMALLAGFFLVLMSALRAGLYLTLDRTTMPLSQAGPAFWLGARFDFRMIASALLPLLVLGSFSWLSPFRDAARRLFWVVLLSACSAGLLIFYVADFLHYRYLNQRLNASVLGFLQDAQISATMIWQTYPVIRILLAVAAGAAGLVWVILRAHRIAAAGVGPERRAARVAWFVGPLLICLVGIFGRLSQYPLRWSDAFNLRNAALANLALNPIQSFLSSLDFRESGYDLKKVREHYAAMSAYLGVAAPDAEKLNFARTFPGRPGAGQPNVVLVICESFSAYKSSMWGNPLNPTPFFRQLTQEGLFFDNCFTPHFGTARGVWATITGIPDVEPVETASRNPKLVDQHTIINDFAGYEKFYFIGGSSSWANIRGLLTNNIAGLHLYEEGSYDAPQIDVWGISDKNLFLEANKVLRQQTKPFFAVIQTADNHRPYTIPKEDLGEFQKLDVPADQLQKAGFESLAEFNAFRYTDFAFQKFFTAARAEKYYENTIFIFIGDHGIGGNAGTMFPPAWTVNELTSYHVPLLFYAPKLIPPQRVHAVASQVDLLPTAAGLVGIPYRNTTLGRDLRRQQEIDGGRGNSAFIIDHHNKWLGVIKGQHFVQHQREDGSRRQGAWADFAAPEPSGGGAAGEDLHRVADAFLETARYLLLNNPKAADAP
jgi:phosphoglycerol transferase MdoB-like AlkP superfamily enzyme